ncbi:MAG: hypothetical protein EOP35_00090 [Rubrivivax sp.]|nr:MAG: hypothetical protein EOP35_00090 [Rubrivivax sp.]
MTHSSDFISEFIRGVEASRPQGAEDWVCFHDVAGPPGALAIPGDADGYRGESPGRSHVVQSASPGLDRRAPTSVKRPLNVQPLIQSAPEVLNLRVQL